MKKLKSTIAQLDASIQGALDGLELDNKDDIIEKSAVIEQLKTELSLIREAGSELKNISFQPHISKPLPTDSETEQWFTDNIDDDSASSAIYKFRLWLNER